MIERNPQLPPQNPESRVAAPAIQPVMDDEKINSCLRRQFQCARRGVDSRANFRHRSRVFDLQPVQRVVPIGDLVDAQGFVAISNDLRKRGHVAES